MFKNSIENFRGLAIIFVMLSHFSTLKLLGVAGEHLLFLIGDATSFFVFIAGYLFAHIEFGRFKLFLYLLKKFKYVISPYIIISTPAIIAGIYLNQFKLLGLTEFNYVIWSLSVGGFIITPMWFIPMIALYFLTNPILNKIRHSHLIYILAITTVGISIFTKRPISNTNPFISYAHFFGFYLLGVIASLNNKILDNISREFAIGIILAGLLIFLFSDYQYIKYISTLQETENIFRLNYVQLGKLGLLISIFIYFEKFMKTKNLFYFYFAERSFGLFFMHGIYMVLFSIIALNFNHINTAFLLTIESIFIIFFSIYSVYLIRKTLGNRSRYVIGC